VKRLSGKLTYAKARPARRDRRAKPVPSVTSVRTGTRANRVRNVTTANRATTDNVNYSEPETATLIPPEAFDGALEDAATISAPSLTAEVLATASVSEGLPAA
jgi:hypothetical protein